MEILKYNNIKIYEYGNIKISRSAKRLSLRRS